MNTASTTPRLGKSPVRRSVTSAIYGFSTPLSPRTPSFPGARPRSRRSRCGGRKSKFLAVINNEQLCRIAGKYLDVMSFNYYTDGVDKDFLRRIYGWTGGRPMILSEFFWGSSKESGLVRP